jgi:hypothetical protein
MPSEVRINAVVHVNTRLPAGTTVPIGWIAVGDPAELFDPSRHDAYWAEAQGAGLSEHAIRRFARRSDHGDDDDDSC